MHLYRFLDGGRRIELVHKTAVEGVPGAMTAFKGRLLVGVDASLRLYDMGALCAVCHGVLCDVCCVLHRRGGGGSAAAALRDANTSCLVARALLQPCCFQHPAPTIAVCPLPHPPTRLPACLLACPSTHPRARPCAGKKRLLRKCEYRRLPTRVATLHVAGSRIYVGDGQESVYFMR